MSAEWVFDDDEFDARVLVERANLAVFTTIDIAALFGCSRETVWENNRAGHLPPPMWPRRHDSDGDRWSREQVVDVMTGLIRRGPRGWRRSFFDPNGSRAELLTTNNRKDGAESGKNSVSKARAVRVVQPSESAR